MKTMILTLVFKVITMIAFAQTSEHLSFKGVPIDGTLNEYISKMKQVGFQHIGTENGMAIMNGDFAGYKDCLVGISALQQKDLVYKIGVLFPEKDTWSRLSTNYFDLKEMLTEKYGKPSEEVEKFDVESFQLPLDDNDKMHEVGMDNCKYYSIWNTDKGEIQLSIEHESVISSFVRLLYIDKINGDKIRAKAKGDL